MDGSVSAVVETGYLNVFGSNRFAVSKFSFNTFVAFTPNTLYSG
jgi:hypothetical protein